MMQSQRMSNEESQESKVTSSAGLKQNVLDANKKEKMYAGDDDDDEENLNLRRIAELEAENSNLRKEISLLVEANKHLKI